MLQLPMRQEQGCLLVRAARIMRRDNMLRCMIIAIDIVRVATVVHIIASLLHTIVVIVSMALPCNTKQQQIDS